MRQDGVGVERDHEPSVAQRFDIADDRGERVPRAAAEEGVELGELPTFSLPSHPDALTLVPLPGAVEEIKDVIRAAGVAPVERTNAIHGGSDDRVIRGE